MSKERIIKFETRLDDTTAQSNSLEFIRDFKIRNGNPAIISIQIEEVDDLANYLDTL